MRIILLVARFYNFREVLLHVKRERERVEKD